MVKLGKLGLACALCLTMSLSLFTSGAFAQNVQQNTASKTAQTVTANLLQGANSALQNNESLSPNGDGWGCGNGCGNGWGGCGNGCGNSWGNGCFQCGSRFSHRRFVRFTRIVRIVRITKFIRYERSHRSSGCSSCGGGGWGGGSGWVGGGGDDGW